MKHGILGPGGVGGLVGAVLAGANENVTLIVRPGTASHYPREISLESPFRNLRVGVFVSDTLNDAFDVLWITVKNTQLHVALQNIPDGLQVEAVVPLLNGIDHVGLLRQRFGHESVIPATIGVESERIAPGKIVHRSPFVRLGMAENGRERLTPAFQIFQRFGFECSFVDDEATLMWSKLVFLAPVALSTAAAQAPIGAVLSDPAKAARLEASVREASEVGARMGAKVDANAVLARIKGLPPQMRSSMEKDLANGNPLELDAIGGPIVRGGARHGIPVPVTSELMHEVTSISA
jgi:2-dehydropantoate 2-reductase